MDKLKELKDLNLLDRFLFAEATARQAGSDRIREIHKNVQRIKENEEVGGQVYERMGRKDTGSAGSL